MTLFKKIINVTGISFLFIMSHVYAMDVDTVGTDATTTDAEASKTRYVTLFQPGALDKVFDQLEARRAQATMTDAEALAPARRFLMDAIVSGRIIKELETQYQRSPEQAVAFLRSLYVGYQKSPQVDMLKSTYGSECGTIYHEAVLSGTADSLWVLTQVDQSWKKNIERLDKSNKNVLHIAAAGRGNYHALEWLCDELLSKETIKKMLLEQNVRKETPLHVAAESGNIKIFKKIFDWAQQNDMLWDLVTTKNKYGETVLHRAAFNNHVEITEMLLQGVGQENLIEFIEMEDNAGRTAMFYIWNAGCHKVRMAYMKNHPNAEKFCSLFSCSSGYQRVVSDEE